MYDAYIMPENSAISGSTDKREFNPITNKYIIKYKIIFNIKK